MPLGNRMRQFSLILVVLCAGFAIAADRAVGPKAGESSACFDDGPSKKKTKKKKKKRRRKPKSDNKLRWGQQRNESNEKYDKRYARLLKRIKQDKRGDYSVGRFVNGDDEEVRLWTLMDHPFIIRSDISREFTADTAMYIEMLHREYRRAYGKLLNEPPDLREAVEVIVFADRGTYMKNGGSPGSGGFFSPASQFRGDRGPFWPARRYRLQQFTDGITDFAKWPKGTLKHEAAHMEIQLRLGQTLYYGYKLGYPVDCPRWWNEGHASVFEYWDFDKTVDENFEEIPFRGRYAPFIRRLHGTDKWKDFHYVWTIDPNTWHRDMTTEQGYLNYCQAWSLAAYMMAGGKKGIRDFRAIYDLSKRVGADRQTTYKGDRTRAWENKFDERKRIRLEKNWNDWVARYVARDKKVPDENYFLMRGGYNPEIIDRLQRFSKDEMESIREEMDKEKEKRRSANRIEK